MNTLFKTWFCLLFRNEEVSISLETENVFGTIGIIMLITSVLFSVIFYFLMDKSRFVGFLWWALVGIILFFTNLLVTFFLAKNALTEAELDFAVTNYLYLGFVVALWAFLLYFIFSLILKRFTTNLVRSPF